MKRILFLILILLLCSCDRRTEPLSTEEVCEHEFLITYDYGILKEGELTLLYDGCYMINDLSIYGVKDLRAGDVVKIIHTGNPKMALSYPGQIVYDDGQIISVEVIRAKIVELVVRQVPGGGYQILSKEDKYYNLPEYIIYGDKFTSAENLYHNLKLYGAIPYNYNKDEIIGLYCDDYDPTKVDLEFD